MQDKKEFILATTIILLLATLCSVVYVRHELNTRELNGEIYIYRGMMKYKAPDGNDLYLPIYTKQGENK